MSFETASGTYERAVIIANPNSSNMGRYDSEVKKLPLDAVPIAVKRSDDPDVPLMDDVRRLWDEMYETLESGDLIMLRSGDGLRNYVVNGLMREEAVAQGFNRLPLWGIPEGNANDGAMQLTGKDSVRTALYEGRAVDLRPLDVWRRGPDGQESLRRASLYFSIGSTATAARLVDESRNSSNPLMKVGLTRLALEGIICLNAAASAPDLVFLEDGEFSLYGSRLMVTGSQVAKLGRTNARLDEPGFEDFKPHPDGRLEAARDMVRLARGRLPGEMKSRVEFTVRTHKKDKQSAGVEVQFDGEGDRVESGSHFIVSESQLTYRALTTKLGKSNRPNGRRPQRHFPLLPIPVSGRFA